MKISPQSKKWGIILICSLCVLALAAFGYGIANRADYLKKVVSRVQAKMKDDYQIDFQVKSYQFDGLTTVVFDKVLVIPEQRDTLASIDKFSVRVDVLPLILGDIKFGSIAASEGKISFVKRDSLSNYDFLFRKKDQNISTQPIDSERNFAEKAEQLFHQVFAIIPDDLSIRNFEIAYQDSLLNQQVRIPNAQIEDGEFQMNLSLLNNDAEWLLEGQIIPSKKRLHVEVSANHQDVEVPFLKGKYGLAVSFDKLIFDLADVKRVRKDLLHIDGSFAYENLAVDHRRLSDQTIILPHAILHGGLEISSDYVAIKDKSSLKIKDFELFPHAKLILNPSKQIALSVHTGRFEAQHFFDALPVGLFESLEGIQVSGGIAYDLNFAVDLDNPDEIIFSSKIDDEDLKVLQWGKVNIDSLNYPFLYDAYDDTTMVRQFVVGPENPNFVPIQQIPYILKNTVRNTEDPFFYKHNGFELEAFKLSIETNLKERKFKRGASTISMQLVKNVFLNRKKTMNRKFEEILLVWLMESSSQVNKDRILEIYFNVIEWGKNVYGIKEASQYYFNKLPQDLTLGESLFLSSIIPRPKTGISSFDHTGRLKPWVQRHFNTYGYIMTKLGELKGFSTPAGYGFYDVELQPLLRPKAPINVDTSFTTILEEHEEAIRQMEQDEIRSKSALGKLLDHKIEKDESDTNR